MVPLLLIALAGFGAQMVDGSLGMGYGLTSTTMLIAIGLTPVMASASVHFAQVGTAFVSGFSHGKLGNVDKTVLRRIAIPGGIGAFIGAMVLSSVSTALARPIMSTILLILGVYVLIRYLRNRVVKLRKGRPGNRFLSPLGLVGGFIDATGGGGWGPVTTPALMTTGRMAPHRVIGTVSAAEFIVAVSASAGFLVGLGLAAVDLTVLLPLLIGGTLAAPIAAWVARKLPMRIMGVAVGGMIIFTNIFTLLRAFDVHGHVVAGTLIAVGALWIGTVTLATVQHFTARKALQDAEASRPISV
jgi:uncharacterized membrane protein YfcA